MEQILAFVLGVIIALVMGLIIVGVLMAFKTASKVKEIEQTITSHQDWILRNDEMMNRRIDQEIDRTNSIFNDCIRHTDSRLDKLTNKLNVTPVAKEFLKD